MISGSSGSPLRVRLALPARARDRGSGLGSDWDRGASWARRSLMIAVPLVLLAVLVAAAQGHAERWRREPANCELINSAICGGFGPIRRQSPPRCRLPTRRTRCRRRTTCRSKPGCSPSRMSVDSCRVARVTRGRLRQRVRNAPAPSESRSLTATTWTSRQAAKLPPAASRSRNAGRTASQGRPTVRTRWFSCRGSSARATWRRCGVLCSYAIAGDVPSACRRPYCARAQLLLRSAPVEICLPPSPA